MSSDSMSSLPVWARVVAFVGLPSALSIYLVYNITQTFIENQREVVTEMRALRQESRSQLQDALVEIGTHRRASESMQTELRLYLRMICVNTSSSNQERQACLAAER